MRHHLQPDRHARNARPLLTKPMHAGKAETMPTPRAAIERSTLPLTYMTHSQAMTFLHTHHLHTKESHRLNDDFLFSTSKTNDIPSPSPQTLLPTPQSRQTPLFPLIALPHSPPAVCPLENQEHTQHPAHLAAHEAPTNLVVPSPRLQTPQTSSQTPGHRCPLEPQSHLQTKPL